MNIRLATRAIILCAALSIMKSISAESVGDPLIVEWTNFVGEKWSYRAREIAGEEIRLELQTNGQTFLVQTNQFRGGIGEMMKLAQITISEISTKQPRIVVGKTKCKLSLQVAERQSERHVAIEGDLKPIREYFLSESHLRKLLSFISENLPKKYRLVDEAGPLKQILPTPGQT